MAALKFLLVAAVVGYIAIAVLVWLSQDSLMFFPRAPQGGVAAPPGWQLEEVRLAARDGTPLAGVLVKPAGARLPLVIYYGGNAEEVTARAAAAAQDYGERAVLLVNYRGYGHSGGRPGEKALVADAIEAYDWAATRADVDPARICLHGTSLGSAVAVQVAAARSPRCVVLTSAFASARAIAQEIYPWLPVRFLMRHPFDAAAHAPALRMPALFLVGEADDIIPPHHSERLASLWGGPVERASFPGFGHNDLGLHPGYGAAIRAFLQRHN